MKQLGSLKDLNLKTLRAYNLKISLQVLWSLQDIDADIACFKKWYYWATHSRIYPRVKVAKTLKSYWDRIITYFTIQYTNGLFEGLNS